MLTRTVDGASGDKSGDLGSALHSYASGFSSTWLLVFLGVFGILVPAAMAIGARAEGDPDWAAFLFVEVIFLPLGLFTISRGLRQRRVSLTLREHGFEYRDGKDRLHAIRYAAVQKLVLRFMGQAPMAMAVYLHGGGSLLLNCLQDRAYREGHAELERRL